MSKICAVVLMTLVSLVLADSHTEEDPFTYDYHRLRVGGLILAAVLCLIGITILLSGHCRCKFNQDKRRRTGSTAQQMLGEELDSVDLTVQQVAGLWVTGRDMRGGFMGSRSFLRLLDVNQKTR
ncbi:uncharacterized protein V6R79_026407 [Siganus canaliculatus]